MGIPVPSEVVSVADAEVERVAFEKPEPFEWNEVESVATSASAWSWGILFLLFLILKFQ